MHFPGKAQAAGRRGLEAASRFKVRSGLGFVSCEARRNKASNSRALMPDMLGFPDFNNMAQPLGQPRLRPTFQIGVAEASTAKKRCQEDLLPRHGKPGRLELSKHPTMRPSRRTGEWENSGQLHTGLMYLKCRVQPPHPSAAPAASPTKRGAPEAAPGSSLALQTGLTPFTKSDRFGKGLSRGSRMRFRTGMRRIP